MELLKILLILVLVVVVVMLIVRVTGQNVRQHVKLEMLEHG